MIKENVNDYVKKEQLIMELEYDFIKSFVELRKNLHLTQAQMASSTNIIREGIARIECGTSSPQLNTILKILGPLGYTIEIVPIKKNN